MCSLRAACVVGIRKRRGRELTQASLRVAFHTLPLYFIYARKMYLRSHGKITRQCKSTLTQPGEKKDAIEHETLETSTVRENDEGKVMCYRGFILFFILSYLFFFFSTWLPCWRLVF